ncbi:MAG TPA: MFS transporter [Fimbriimonadaceae bacterium]|nr:MFS transporter [Fimbriimonadaceae bacterium]
MSSGYKNTWLWNLGFSAYWFATSWKWFVVLLIVLPAQVKLVLTNQFIAAGNTAEAAARLADGVKDARWGWVIGIGAVWAVFGPAIFGGLSDRIRTKWGHRQPFIAIGAAMTAVALITLGGAHAYWMLVAGYLFLQVSDDVGTGPYSAMVPEAVPEEHRGKASSIMSMLQLLGQLGSGIVAIVLVRLNGLEAAISAIYLGVASVNIACAIVTLITVRKVRAGEVHADSKEPFLKQWIRPFRSPDFVWVWVTRFINALGFYLVVEFLQYFIGGAYKQFVIFGFSLPGDTHADQASTATLLLALTLALTGAIGAGVASRFADRWGRKRLIYTSGVIVFCALVPFAFARDLTQAFYLAVVFGVGYGLYLSADWALVSDVVPNKDAAGSDMGVWQMSISSVQLVSGLAGWAIGSLNKSSPLLGYMSAIVFAGCLFLLSTVLVRQVKGSR